MANLEKLKIMLEAPKSTSIVAYRTFLKDILEESEKYRWHDLRKNPDDLPEDFHNVVICLNGFEGNPVGVDMKDKRTRKEKHVDQVICYDGLEACCSKKAKEWFRQKPYGKVRKDDDRAEH